MPEGKSLPIDFVSNMDFEADLKGHLMNLVCSLLDDSPLLRRHGA
jgi:hypothetical protein